MGNPVISFEREFQIWSYSIGHGKLLLRSRKSRNHETRVDVLFTDVRSIETRTSLETLVVEEVDSSEVTTHRVQHAQTMEKGHKVFLIKSHGWTGCIVAGAVHWHEDHGEYGQPSALLG